jgi:hypothetical protein
MIDTVQKAYAGWRQKEERANHLAGRAAVSRREVAEARKDATEAWRVYWQQRWQVERENPRSLPIQAARPISSKEGTSAENRAYR